MTTLRKAAQQALEALEKIADWHGAYGPFPERNEEWRAMAVVTARESVTALRKLLAQPEPRNQCGETCERAKLCAVCARGLEEWELMRPTFQEIQNAAANLRVMKEMFGDSAASCDIAEDGVCEVIDCCRNPPLILEALEIGYDSAQAEAAQYHAAMAGYRPERHAAMDADVEKIAKAISAVKAALAQEEPKESVRDLLIGAAAMAVAAERKGVYPGASEVADAVLAQKAETTRAQRMRDEGYTRRPTLREMAQEGQEPTVRIKCTVVDNQHPNGIPFEQWVNAPQQEQEPVAWMVYTEDGKSAYVTDNPHDLVGAYKAFALYTAPPHREWHPLTDKEIRRMGIETPGQQGGWNLAFARAVERALKEKNHV